MKDKVICNCGGYRQSHESGAPNCYRYVVDKDKEPTNRRRIYHPDWFGGEPTWVWDVGKGWVTEYTLFYQRNYAKCKETGRWTRPKSHESVNSLQ